MFKGQPKWDTIVHVWSRDGVFLGAKRFARPEDAKAYQRTREQGDGGKTRRFERRKR